MSNPHLFEPHAGEGTHRLHTRALVDLRLDPSSLSKSEVTGARIAFAVSGFLALVLGVLVLAWPEVTLAAVALLFGLYFVASGVVRIVRGIAMSGTLGSRVLAILFGVLLLVAGIITIRNPLNSLLVLGLLIGLCWIVEGVAALVETAPDSSRWFGTLLGAVSVVAGIVVLVAPLESLGVLVILGGVFLVLSGSVQLMEAFTFGREARAQTEKVPTTTAAPVSRDTD
ncbi:hypothetical protein E3T55_07555 [Cryobacterium frigoriphilum]|uniref:HdeD family acid-resistance protein n=1 Tax=Cryobacterium frigoriphilum TaxID=1259150 RepID=A0A4R9A3U7_9MICO|nr:DUF308 domain-containing protein [Cryobacterium frigoriphilum]TFD51566.1 hypothetical protein E3T55_07555 [Cryobacterium frigoriphilum]